MIPWIQDITKWQNRFLIFNLSMSEVLSLTRFWPRKVLSLIKLTYQMLRRGLILLRYTNEVNFNVGCIYGEHPRDACFCVDGHIWRVKGEFE